MMKSKLLYGLFLSSMFISVEASSKTHTNKKTGGSTTVNTDTKSVSTLSSHPNAATTRASAKAQLQKNTTRTITQGDNTSHLLHINPITGEPIQITTADGFAQIFRGDSDDNKTATIVGDAGIYTYSTAGTPAGIYLTKTNPSESADISIVKNVGIEASKATNAGNIRVDAIKGSGLTISATHAGGTTTTYQR